MRGYFLHIVYGVRKRVMASSCNIDYKCTGVVSRILILRCVTYRQELARFWNWIYIFVHIIWYFTSCTERPFCLCTVSDLVQSVTRSIYMDHMLLCYILFRVGYLSIFSTLIRFTSLALGQSYFLGTREATLKDMGHALVVFKLDITVLYHIVNCEFKHYFVFNLFYSYAA